MDFEKLADLLYPNVKYDVQYYLNKYPSRKIKDGAEVTRLAPSPTGFLHLGSLYSAMISNITAQKSGGVFYLRLEDTDRKRFIDGAGDIAYNMLNKFDIKIDEGYCGDNQKQIGDYGDYVQSNRLDIYYAFAKELVKKGRAFPCFCGENESKESVLERREKELNDNETITEHDDACRNLSFDEIKANIDAGKPWALKLLSIGNPEKQFEFEDLIKGKRLVRENGKDVVLVKSNGIPPYALAHVVDDTLMHTTIVVRGEEWYPSLSAHIEIFNALNLPIPKYAHTPVICKFDNGNKRKLSKRKDAEADVRFFVEQGYPVACVKDYLMNLLNSDFEIWRTKNPTAPLSEFDFSISKIGSNNPMFDMDKLNDMSKNLIGYMTAENVYSELISWANNYDVEFAKLLDANKEKMLAMLSVDRGGPKVRKDIIKMSDVKNVFGYILNDLFYQKTKADFEFDGYNLDLIKEVANHYLGIYNDSDAKEDWFPKIKASIEEIGFASDMKAYKANPEAYKGSVADYTTIIRILLTGKRNTPDLASIIKILGKEEMQKRFNFVIDLLSK